MSVGWTSWHLHSCKAGPVLLSRAMHACYNSCGAMPSSEILYFMSCTSLHQLEIDAFILLGIALT